MSEAEECEAKTEANLQSLMSEAFHGICSQVVPFQCQVVVKADIQFSVDNLWQMSINCKSRFEKAEVDISLGLSSQNGSTSKISHVPVHWIVSLASGEQQIDLKSGLVQKTNISQNGATENLSSRTVHQFRTENLPSKSVQKVRAENLPSKSVEQVRAENLEQQFRSEHLPGRTAQVKAENLARGSVQQSRANNPERGTVLQPIVTTETAEQEFHPKIMSYYSVKEEVESLPEVMATITCPNEDVVQGAMDDDADDAGSADQVNNDDDEDDDNNALDGNAPVVDHPWEHDHGMYFLYLLNFNRDFSPNFSWSSFYLVIASRPLKFFSYMAIRSIKILFPPPPHFYNN